MISLYLFILPICTIHQFNVVFLWLKDLAIKAPLWTQISIRLLLRNVDNNKLPAPSQLFSNQIEYRSIDGLTLSRHCSLSTVKLNEIENEFKFYVRRYLDEIHFVQLFQPLSFTHMRQPELYSHIKILPGNLNVFCWALSLIKSLIITLWNMIFREPFRRKQNRPQCISFILIWYQIKANIFFIASDNCFSNEMLSNFHPRAFLQIEIDSDEIVYRVHS